MKKPIFGKLSEGGKAFLKDNIFKSCDRMPAITLPNTLSPNASPLSSSEEFESSSYVPPYQCSSILYPVLEVPSKVDQYVGVGKVQAPSVVTSNIDIEEDLKQVYPNPTQGLVKLKKSDSWALINLQGEVLMKGSSEILDMSSYPAGLYFLKQGQIVVKIQKQ